MSATLTIPAPRRVADYLAEEAVCLLLGGGLTFGLFLGIARFESVRPVAPPSDIEDLRMMSAFTEPPPPSKPEERSEPDEITPLTGIEIARSDSSVKLAVVPPDLNKIIPSQELPPRATIQFSQLLDLKPKAGMSGDFQHIYQQNEVDQAPKAIVQKIAKVNTRARDGAEELRVNLLLVISTTGEVQSIRVIRPSGNLKFDKIVLECVRDEWEFSPAVMKGKKVRCMVQQQVWYKWTGGNSPFTL